MQINPNRKKIRVRSKMKSADWRLSLNRSIRYLSAQLINTRSGEVALGVIDKKFVASKEKMSKTEKAAEFGKWFGAQLQEKKIAKLAIDRGRCLYHGRIKAFVEGLRTAGVKV